MGFPIARAAGRAALIGAMIAGGMLMAGIAQAQAQEAPGAAPPPSATVASDGQPSLADRRAELVAAAGGPAPVDHLMVVAPERPAVETRADDVADAAPDPSDALNAAQAGAAAPAGAAQISSSAETSAAAPPAMR